MIARIEALEGRLDKTENLISALLTKSPELFASRLQGAATSSRSPGMSGRLLRPGPNSNQHTGLLHKGKLGSADFGAGVSGRVLGGDRILSNKACVEFEETQLRQKALKTCETKDIITVWDDRECLHLESGAISIQNLPKLPTPHQNPSQQEGAERNSETLAEFLNLLEGKLQQLQPDKVDGELAYEQTYLRRTGKRPLVANTKSTCLQDITNKDHLPAAQLRTGRSPPTAKTQQQSPHNPNQKPAGGKTAAGTGSHKQEHPSAAPKHKQVLTGPTQVPDSRHPKHPTKHRRTKTDLLPAPPGFLDQEKKRDQRSGMMQALLHLTTQRVSAGNLRM